mmetsp:Transcript_31907/g.51297  ORF Transcript_31907/g.51297 Transcript_31907/m.51297 type:complete len:340 (-) Transcript_31907:936-1955(-)
MALEAVDLRGRHLRLAESCPDALLLRRSVRGGDARAAAVLIYLAPSNGRKGLGVVLGQLHVNSGDALPTAVAIRGFVVGETTTFEGQHPATAATDEPTGAVSQLSATAQHPVQGIIVLVLQVQLAAVHRHETSRTSSVDGLAGSLEVQRKVDAIRNDRLCSSASRSIGFMRNEGPLRATDANENPDVLGVSLQGFEFVSSHRSRLVADLQRLALVRIHGARLCAADAEEFGVEELDAINIALMLRVRQASHLCSLHVAIHAVDVGVPTAGRDFNEGVAAGLGEHEPVTRVILGVPPEMCGDAVDDHGLALWRRRSELRGRSQDRHVATDFAQHELWPLA